MANERNERVKEIADIATKLARAYRDPDLDHERVSPVYHAARDVAWEYRRKLPMLIGSTSLAGSEFRFLDTTEWSLETTKVILSLIKLLSESFDETIVSKGDRERHAACLERAATILKEVVVEPSPEVQIEVSEDNTIVTVNGKAHRLAGMHDGKFIRLLLAHRGTAITADEIQNEIGQRPDRIYGRLPESVQELIDKPGRGQRGYFLR